MLQNARVTAFTVFDLLRENQQEGAKLPLPPLPTQIRVKLLNAKLPNQPFQQDLTDALKNLGLKNKDSHYVKSVRIWSFSGPYFPAFALNTERYGVFLRIQSKCGKIRTRKTLNTDTFHAAFISFKKVLLLIPD